MSTTETPSYTDVQLSHRFGRLAWRKLMLWSRQVSPDHLDDMKQEAWVYALEHPDEPRLNWRAGHAMQEYLGRWVNQVKSHGAKGLGSLEHGATSADWLGLKPFEVEQWAAPRASDPARQAMARLQIARLWSIMTPAEKRAIACLVLSATDSNGGIAAGEPQRFGFSGHNALQQRLHHLRRRLSATAHA